MVCLLISSSATPHFVSETKWHVNNKNYLGVIGEGACVGIWRRQWKGEEDTGME